MKIIIVIGSEKNKIKIRNKKKINLKSFYPHMSYILEFKL